MTGGRGPVYNAAMLLRLVVLLFALLSLADDAVGQRRRGWIDRSQYPTWTIDPEFSGDVFTFARIEFTSYDRFGGWRNDYPDCDWNFSFRLQQLTSMKVDPDGVTLRLTDPRLNDYPFIYFSNVNNIQLDDREVATLRHYLLNGGFMMADDFWSAGSWRHVYAQMKRVFPDREPRELTRDHPIFHIVYDIQGKPQVPSLDQWRRGYLVERHHGDMEGDEDPHFQAFFDDDDHVVALLCHNNDIGDGWEREGEEQEYFSTYSEKLSFPLGINIVTYALTH